MKGARARSGKSKAVRWAMAAAVALSLACAFAVAASSRDAGGSAPRESTHAAVFVVSDLRGYLAPCGCSENMRGGIARAAAQLEEAKRAKLATTLLDAGDSIFRSARLAPAEVPQEERKAKALATTFRQMGLSARAQGERDLALGSDFLNALGLPELASGQGKTAPLGGHILGVVAGTDAQALAKAAKSVRGQGAQFVIALFHGTFAQAQKAAGDPAVDANLIVASHAQSELDGEDNKLVKTRIPVAQLQNKGRSLMRVDVFFAEAPGPFELLATRQDVERELDALGQRIELLNQQINLPGLPSDARALRQQKLQELVQRRAALAEQKAPRAEGRNAFSLRFIPLEATLPSAPEVAKTVKAYDQDVGRLNLAWAKKHGRDCPEAPQGQAAFVGNAQCKACHPNAFTVYGQSKHAHAYPTLVAEGKQYHLDCVACHLTGYQKPGGVCRIDQVAGREGVGCESCHGPGSLHAQSPSAKNIHSGNSPQTCIGCHDRENSPHFDFKTYLAQILGPGHGERAKAKPGAAP